MSKKNRSETWGVRVASATYLLALAASAGGCATTKGGEGSETHFVCQADPECGRFGPGYVCSAGACTPREAQGVSRTRDGAPSKGPEPSDAMPRSSAPEGAAFGCLDLSNLPRTPAISFRDDLMPIFALSCVASACHDMSAKKAGLVLGDPSACGPVGVSCYDPNAQWKFTFKAPVPTALLDAVYAGLVNVQSTIAPVKLVTPGDPTASFLLDTVMGTENSSRYTPQCHNADPQVAPGPCGSDMPLNSPSLCVYFPDEVQAIAQWILQGAPMN